jgi:hypothetical protein
LLLVFSSVHTLLNGGHCTWHFWKKFSTFKLKFICNASHWNVWAWKVGCKNNYLVLRYWLSKKWWGREVFNFCIYMHIGPIFRFHFIDCYHSELPEVTTSFNQRKTQECSEFLQREIGVVSLWSIQFKRHENFNADFFNVVFIFVWW